MYSKPLVLIFFLLFYTQLFSQRNINHDSYNRIGIQGGITHTNIFSEEFQFQPQYGFMAGFTTRANTYKKFFIVYGVNFYQFITGMNGVGEIAGTVSQIDFKATGVQINLFLGHMLIGEYLMLDVGPIFQLNGKLITGEDNSDTAIAGYELTAKDLEEISKFNFSLAANLSAGFRFIKLSLQYQYGLTNIFRGYDLEALQNKDPRITSLNGNLGVATAGIVFYF